MLGSEVTVLTAETCIPGSEGLVHASIVENLNIFQYLFAIFTDQIWLIDWLIDW
jgi:hypothetical protein